LSGGTEFSTVRFDGDEGTASGVYAGMQPLTALDIAESAHWAASQPAHVNINTIGLMPVDQNFAPFQVQRPTDLMPAADATFRGVSPGWTRCPAALACDPLDSAGLQVS
jgi:hypothetical protein